MKNYMLVLFFSIAALSRSQDDGDKIVGVWRSELKGGEVQIYKMGNMYFGKIIQYNGPKGANNKQVLDVNNPDTSKRKLPLVGLVFLVEFKYDRRHKKWWGKLYDYDGPKGKTFNSYMQFNKQGTLDLTGYMGASWMGLRRTTILNKVMKD